MDNEFHSSYNYKENRSHTLLSHKEVASYLLIGIAIAVVLWEISK